MSDFKQHLSSTTACIYDRSPFQLLNNPYSHLMAVYLGCISRLSGTHCQDGLHTTHPLVILTKPCASNNKHVANVWVFLFQLSGSVSWCHSLDTLKNLLTSTTFFCVQTALSNRCNSCYTVWFNSNSCSLCQFI